MTMYCVTLRMFLRSNVCVSIECNTTTQGYTLQSHPCVTQLQVKMQCNAMQCNATQSNAMQCNAMQRNTMQSVVCVNIIVNQAFGLPISNELLGTPSILSKSTGQLFNAWEKEENK